MNNGSLNNICFKCNVIHETGEYVNQPHTVHCIVCNKCIFEFNHHCFWANKCIGKENLYIFYSFLILVALNLFVIFKNCYTIFSVIKLDEVNHEYNDKISQIPLYIFLGNLKDSILTYSAVRNYSFLVLIVSAIFLLPILLLICIHVYNEYNNFKNRQKKVKMVFSERDSLSEKLIEIERAE